jgi:hypothetical protein
MTKLESLADRPAKKRDIGKKIFYISSDYNRPYSIREYEISDIQHRTIYSYVEEYDKMMYVGHKDSPGLFWQKPVIISESELTKLRDLVERAKLIFVVDNKFNYCIDKEQWLKEAKEVQDGKTSK